MNAAQQRFLLNRLDEARRAKPSRYDPPKLDEPKTVVEARAAQEKAKRIIEKHQKTVERARKHRSGAIDKLFNEAKTQILFATSEVAIRAIEKFESAIF